MWHLARNPTTDTWIWIPGYQMNTQIITTENITALEEVTRTVPCSISCCEVIKDLKKKTNKNKNLDRLSHRRLIFHLFKVTVFKYVKQSTCINHSVFPLCERNLEY